MFLSKVPRTNLAKDSGDLKEEKKEPGFGDEEIQETVSEYESIMEFQIGKPSSEGYGFMSSTA